MKKTSLIVFLFSLALFLQFYHLGERSLWEDEARVAAKAYRPLQNTLLLPKNLPFNLILSSWSRFGKSEFWLRIPSVLFALFSLVALYEVGKKLYSARVALLATLLLATSPFFLLESRQVKMYSLVLFFSLLSVYFLVLFFETGRTRFLSSHVGISLTALLTHYMFIPFYVAQLIFVMGWLRKENPRLAKRYIASVLCTFFLFLPALPEQRTLKKLGELYLHAGGAETLSFPAGYLGKVGFVFYLFSIGPTIFPWKWGWVLLGGSLALFLLFYSIKRGISDRSFKLTWVLTMLPVLLLSALRNAQPRYSLISLPFYVMLLASGISRLRFWIKGPCLAGLLLLHVYGVTNYFAGRQYLFIAQLEPYREVAQQVLDHYQPGDYLLSSQANPSLHYYLTHFYQMRGARKRLRSVDKEGVLKRMTWKELRQNLPSGTKRLWFIERPPGQFIENEFPILDAEGIYRENLEFRSFLDHHFKRLGRWGYLKDPDIEQKKKFLKKFYMEERITISLYSLLDPL